jgi:hypothetical protein
MGFARAVGPAGRGETPLVPRCRWRASAGCALRAGVGGGRAARGRASRPALAGGDTSGGGMPRKAAAAARTHCATASRVTSRRSAATILANRDGSPVTTGAVEYSQARLTRPPLAMAFDQNRFSGRAMAPRVLTGSGSAASISSAHCWHRMMTTAKSVIAAIPSTMNTSAKSTREPVAAMTLASTSDPITTAHDTAPVRRTRSGLAG